MIDAEIILVKYWLEVKPEKQQKRLEDRVEDGRKIWKLSQLDIDSYDRWDDYSQATLHLIDRHGHRPLASLLEVGPGDGALLDALATRADSVTALDNSAAMLDKARDRAGHLSNVDFRLGEAGALHSEGATFDAVAIVETRSPRGAARRGHQHHHPGVRRHYHRPAGGLRGSCGGGIRRGRSHRGPDPCGVLRHVSDYRPLRRPEPRRRQARADCRGAASQRAVLPGAGGGGRHRLILPRSGAGGCECPRTRSRPRPGCGNRGRS